MMDRNKLQKILEKHKKWLNRENDGKCADLTDADLRYTDLSGVNLRYANLSRANLKGADLSGVNLRYANLKGADLRDANLRYVVLRDANLSRANLKGADLSVADLTDADLRYANLRDADLSGADLTYADLSGADLDFSCLPLWCGSLLARFDDKQIIQLCYHVVKAGLQSKNTSEETKAELSKLIDFANKFHRVEEGGKIEINNKISDVKEEA